MRIQAMTVTDFHFLFFVKLINYENYENYEKIKNCGGTRTLENRKLVLFFKI